MAGFHKIKAYLYENHLTDDPNDFTARVASERSLGIDDICESAVTRGGADIPAAAMSHAVKLFLKEMGYQLCDGLSVNADGWFTVAASIKGTFYSPTDRFDPTRHYCVFELHQGARLRKELETADIDIMGVAESGAYISQVIDVKTGAVNDTVTTNRNLHIFGGKIRITGDNDHPGVGVYFVPQGGGERVKVDPSDIVINNPSELLVVTPALTAGAYKLEIVTQFAAGKILLKEPRTAIFDKILTVA